MSVMAVMLHQIVLVHVKVQLLMMNVVFVMVITHLVLTVLERQMVIHL